MQKRYEIFVSSTRLDLIDERASIRDYIVRSGNIPCGMEDFGGKHQPAWDTIVAAIDQADYYVLIIADRYGSIDPATGLSYTEKEFRYAREHGKPAIVFMKETMGAEEGIDDPRRLRAFRNFVAENYVVHWREGELVKKVVEQLPLFIGRTPVEGGWVPAAAYENLQREYEVDSFLRNVYTYLFNRLNPYDDIQLTKDFLADLGNESLDKIQSVVNALSILLKTYVDRRLRTGVRAYFAYRLTKPVPTLQHGQRFVAHYRLGITSSSEGNWAEGIALGSRSNINYVYTNRAISDVPDARKDFSTREGENQAVPNEGSVIGAPVLFNDYAIGVVGLSSANVGEVSDPRHHALAREIKVIFSAVFAYARLREKTTGKPVTYRRLRNEINDYFERRLGPLPKGRPATGSRRKPAATPVAGGAASGT